MWRVHRLDRITAKKPAKCLILYRYAKDLRSNSLTGFFMLLGQVTWSGQPGVILSHRHQIHITVLPRQAVVVTISQMNPNTSPNVDFPELVAETLEIWEQNARWWDAKMGEGNKWHRSLIAPATERLLSTQPGERVLELACGNGQFARRLASFGAHVVSSHFSRAFLDFARLRTSEHAQRIDYLLLDLTSEGETAALRTTGFYA